jgi:hypothetical protein
MKVSASTPAVIFRVSLGCVFFCTKMLAIEVERDSITVTLYAPIPELFGSNLGWNIGYPDCNVHVFPQSLQEHVGIVSKLPITVAARSKA